MTIVTKGILCSVVMAASSFAAAGIKSGPQVGDSVNAFEPTHVTGPDKGTETCPVCKYGSTPAVQVWANTDDLSNVGKIAEKLEGTITKRGLDHFRVFVVYMNPQRLSASVVSSRLKALAKTHHLKNVALTFVSSPAADAVKEYNIAPEAKNTVIVYANRKVVSSFVNLQAAKATDLVAVADSVSSQ